jgi:hypothetical protein
MSNSILKIRKVCEWCKTEFEAQKSSTRYCSHLCNSRAYKAQKRLEKKTATEKKTDEIIRHLPIEDFKDREFLNVSQTATLLGLCKKTIYNLIYTGKLKATRITNRITIIQRKDIDGLLQLSNPYKIEPRPTSKPITQFYTFEEITAKYGVKTRRIWDIIKSQNIPTFKKGKKTYISQKHIDNHFKKNPPRKKTSL